MTKTLNKLFSALLVIAMLFGLTVIGSAADSSFALKSGSALATSGSFKKQYVGNIKITVKADKELIATDSLKVVIKEDGGTTKTYNASSAEITVNKKTAVITVAYNASMDHGTNYTITVDEGSFADIAGNTNSSYSFTVSGNIILENLNVDRPSTTMQKFINWLSSWTYAEYIKPIINLLKWFDAL